MTPDPLWGLACLVTAVAALAGSRASLQIIFGMPPPGASKSDWQAYQDAARPFKWAGALVYAVGFTVGGAFRSSAPLTSPDAWVMTYAFVVSGLGFAAWFCALVAPFFLLRWRVIWRKRAKRRRGTQRDRGTG